MIKQPPVGVLISEIRFPAFLPSLPFPLLLLLVQLETSNDF